MPFMYRRPEAVLFDVDGVFRTVPLKFIHHAHMEALQELAPDHRLQRHARIITELRGSSAFINESRDFIELLGHVALEGKKAGQVLRSLHRSRQDTDRLRKFLHECRVANGIPERLGRAYARYRALREGPEGQKAVRTIRTAIKGLRRLMRAGIAVCLVTNSSKAPVLDWLQKEGLPQVEVLAKEDVTFQKPDPQGIQVALARLGIQFSSHVYYVGDQPNDIEAAKRAGVNAIGVATRGRWAPLAASRPYAIFRHVGEVADHLLGKTSTIKKVDGVRVSTSLSKA